MHNASIVRVSFNAPGYSGSAGCWLVASCCFSVVSCRLSPCCGNGSAVVVVIVLLSGSVFSEECRDSGFSVAVATMMSSERARAKESNGAQSRSGEELGESRRRRHSEDVVAVGEEEARLKYFPRVLLEKPRFTTTQRVV